MNSWMEHPIYGYQKLQEEGREVPLSASGQEDTVCEKK